MGSCHQRKSGKNERRLGKKARFLCTFANLFRWLQEPIYVLRSNKIYRISELLEAILGDFLLNGQCDVKSLQFSLVCEVKLHRPLSRKSPKTATLRLGNAVKNTVHTQQVKFFKLYFSFNIFSEEYRRLFSIEFQLQRLTVRFG